MYKKNYKGRCEKKSLSKCDTICRCYSTIQSVYADKLQTDPSVQSFQCNAPLEDEDYTTDFLITRQDGTQYVRECCRTKPSDQAQATYNQTSGHITFLLACP